MDDFPAVKMDSITIRFGSVTAVDKVSVAIQSRGIHAVVGENGAGKTTLMRALYGAVKSEYGSIEVNGTIRKFENSAQAIEAGIGMVSQHYSIIGELTCLENLMLGAEPGRLIDKDTARDRACQLAAQMGFSFEWDQPASRLSPAGAQKLEILKLLWRNARVMILDEPTAMLSPADARALFESLAKLAAEGATIILVTHRLPEVLDHCQQVTVLRAGKVVADRAVLGLAAEELAELIVGRKLGPAPIRSLTPGGDLMSVKDLSVEGDRGNLALSGVSFSLRQGEVVGIAGVDGSGQRELFQILAGVRRAKSGSITLEARDIQQLSTAERLAIGLRVIPEDRHEEAIIEPWPLTENALLGFQRLAPFHRGAWINDQKLGEFAQETCQRFDTKFSSLSMPISSLSGGNQQRFVAARVLSQAPRLILAFQPARGLDIDATRRLYAAIREECENGAACLVISFDLDELLDNCDRIVVMNSGRLSIPAQGQELDRAAIGKLMVGAS